MIMEIQSAFQAAKSLERGFITWQKWWDYFEGAGAKIR